MLCVWTVRVCGRWTAEKVGKLSMERAIKVYVFTIYDDGLSLKKEIIL